MTVRLSAVVCLTLPPDAVTITESLCALCDDPQPVATRTDRESNAMAQNVRPLRLQNGQSSSAKANPSPTFPHSRNLSFFAPVAAAMVRVVLAIAPDGITVCGEKEQLSPEGRPEQLKLTACVNPF